MQIELKTLGVNPRRAMEQIVEYKHDPGNGYTKTLLCFMQLFIVSNRDRTYYFANNNARHFAFNADERFLPIYEFADEGNRKITQLDEFADHFLKKCDLGRTISRYMVLLAGEQKLMIMRPYQVYAVQHIVQCIAEDNGNGYIWHTTGSGKTLTSFKASTLLKENDHIHKCVFVVDRKDLDRQTREEFNKFQEGCVEENTNTAALVRRLLSEDYADKVIVTTIQKLGLALDETSKRNKQRKKNDQPTYKEMLEPLGAKRIVFIFDECHRSQFGENHKAIKAFFPKAQLFGFTGTPIFRGPKGNASRSKNRRRHAVASYADHGEDLFQKAAPRLHHHPRHRGRERPALPRRLLQTRGQEAAQARRSHRQEGRYRRHPRQARCRDRRTPLQRHLRHRVHQRRHRIPRVIQDHAGGQTGGRSRLQAAEHRLRLFPARTACGEPRKQNVTSSNSQEDLPQEQEDNLVEPEKKKKAA